ncbi:superoxide dismutase [Methanothermobacter tenebrarum]|uniref:Superoxide dismutase n=1 Tax=Methanothermobacter tenebrarum TaxID=680118 RepID=A0A328PBY7_9EURY|nr:superoxide dismutase [Methanothermobacter tenebrarum]MBC7101470.1 superoxide dismutase [Methanobacteriales archaeon]MBC7118158.1 superoxide dismutase [Methanobacteriaceae archaeon]NPV64597.1 superoxide dismutase [Methanobacteriaceae archaeon]RAO78673.1 superoxide dismutase [Methanothermobacter tenebrarum]
MEKKFYELPSLPYSYDALEPYISEEQLTIHHQKHHQAYVDGANNLLRRLDEARESNASIDYKATAKELSFHVGGFLLHRFFWENMGPADENGGEPTGKIKDHIEKDFGTFERFKEEFSQTAIGTEGSGWAMLTYCPLTDRLLIVQVEKHNVNLIPQCKVLLVLDVWEHAYYLDYKNLRPDYVEAFWNIINWDEVNNRIENL